MAPYAVRLGLLRHRQRTDFAGCRTVKMQCPAAQQAVAQRDHREIADGLRHLELRARQHHARGGLAVDEFEDRLDIAHHRFAGMEIQGAHARFHKGVRVKTADHAACASPITMRVPISSAARSRSITRSAEPGAIRTCPTPAVSAAMAAFSLARIPPVEIPLSINPRLSATVRAARTRRAPSITPSTSVRKTSCCAPNADAQATAI